MYSIAALSDFITFVKKTTTTTTTSPMLLNSKRGSLLCIQPPTTHPLIIQFPSHAVCTKSNNP